MKALAFLALLFSFQVWAEDPKVEALIVQGDGQERLHHTRAALACYRAAEKIDPNNLGIVLRISKQYSDLISETKPEAAAEKIARHSLDYAMRASQLDANNAKVHLNLAISYGRMTDFVGNKLKIEYSKIIRNEAVRSIELDPTDDYAWHVLGRWNYEVANVSGILKVIAKVVYGGLPQASDEDAVKNLKKASEIAPQRILHHSELARIYKTMGKHDLAVKEWEAVLALPSVDKDDDKEKKLAETALGRSPGEHQ